MTATGKLLRSPSALIGGALVTIVVLLIVAGPWFSPYAYDTIDFAAQWSAAPGGAAHHWFGTDSLGRDLFVRTLQGGRMSLLLGLAATVVSLLIGVAWGAAAGYYGGRVDELMMRIVDVFYALPFMFLVILLTVFFGHHIVLIFVAVGAVNWLDMARIVRGQTLSLRGREFVQAARVAGRSSADIIWLHIVPNLLGLILIYATLTIPHVILTESFLSFLGLGVQEPAASWGVLVNDGAREMESAPWSLIFPAAFLAVTLLGFNLLGDGLRDALDPK